MSHLFIFCSVFLFLKCFLFQGRDGFTTTSKTQVENLEEDYIFMAVGLWNNMVSSTTNTVAYWTVWVLGSNSTLTRLSSKEGGEERI